MTGLMVVNYPERAAERDQWILAQRGTRNSVDPDLPYAFLVERERTPSGDLADVATVFLTNRECPWRCVMCDLWRNTVSESVRPGAIPAQISHALSQLPAASQIKLYNSGSFFDPLAIPLVDYDRIAFLLNKFERVIVESHPALVGEKALRFRNLLTGRLEVAMGLETVHPEGLARLNKRMTLDQFRTAAAYLGSHDIDMRVFVLVQPPFVPVAEALHWAQRSIDFAFDCGATAVTVIPTRAGNGAMELLRASGDFTPPSLHTAEAALEYGIRARRGRVFLDLWDVHQVASCEACRVLRIERLASMNLAQTILPNVSCEICDGAS